MSALLTVCGTPGEAGTAPSRQCRIFTGAAVGINLVMLGAIGLQVPPGLTPLLASIVKIFGAEMEAPR